MTVSTRCYKLQALIPTSNNTHFGDMEFIDLLDEQGNKLGKMYARSKGNPTPEGTYFAVVEVWVRIKDCLLLIQRHSEKDFGLKWECPGGTVRSTETPLVAVKRELFEETRILLPCEQFTYLGVIKRDNWFCHSYLANLESVDIKIKLQDEECVDYKYVDIRKMDDFLGELTAGHKETFFKYRDKIVSVN